MPRSRTLADVLWPRLEAELFDHPGEELTFNPWTDRDPEFDTPDAPSIRRENFRTYLSHFAAGRSAPRPVVLVGEAPSWRGCRFSGIPFTAEVSLLDPSFPVRGGRTSTFREKPLSEASATIVWGCLRPHFPHFLLLNALPIHPFPAGRPLANRTPRRAEVSAYRPLLEGLLSDIGARLVVAVGRTAERSLAEAGISHKYVRHPSHGGAREFEAGALRALAGA